MRGKEEGVNKHIPPFARHQLRSFNFEELESFQLKILYIETHKDNKKKINIVLIQKLK